MRASPRPGFSTHPNATSPPRSSGGTAACCSANWYSSINPVFYMDDMACSGSEPDLSRCSYRGWGQENCGGSEVASVTCS